MEKRHGMQGRHTRTKPRRRHGKIIRGQRTSSQKNFDRVANEGYRSALETMKKQLTEALSRVKILRGAAEDVEYYSDTLAPMWGYDNPASRIAQIKVDLDKLTPTPIVEAPVKKKPDPVKGKNEKKEAHTD